jgi:hypothetical protein
MARYSSIPIISTIKNPKRRYINVKYPEIKVDFTDTYVYVTKGDRYDLLALSYYGDAQLWWIISRANLNNTSPDSIFPTPGSQIRIPAYNRIGIILNQFDSLNK